MIVLLLGTLAAAGAAGADGPEAPLSPPAVPTPGPLDQQVTIVGRDEAALPLPSPWEPLPFSFPPADLRRPETPPSPPFQPPLGDWAGFLPQAGYTYVGCAGGTCAGETEIHSV